jgi:hypothetical protein
MTDQEQDKHDSAIDEIILDGPHGALAIMATAIVILLWLALYFLVFVRRGFI